MTQEPQVGRPAWNFPTVDDPQSRLVVDRVGGHRPNECDFVRDCRLCAAKARRAPFRTCLPGKAEGRLQKFSGLLIEMDFQAAGMILSVAFGQLGLGSNRSIWLGPPC